jgi:hypothetical protein
MLNKIRNKKLEGTQAYSRYSSMVDRINKAEKWKEKFQIIKAEKDEVMASLEAECAKLKISLYGA